MNPRQAYECESSATDSVDTAELIVLTVDVGACTLSLQVMPTVFNHDVDNGRREDTLHKRLL